MEYRYIFFLVSAKPFRYIITSSKLVFKLYVGMPQLNAT